MRHVSPRLAQLTDHARSLTSAGDLAGARAVLDDALAPADVDPMRASPELADAAALQARILVTLGDPTAARAWAGFAHAAAHRLHGPHDERTLATAATHAAVLHRVGSHTRAAELYRDILHQLTATDGPDSARALAAEADLATAEHAGGHCAAARSRLSGAWRRHRDAYGDAAPAGIKMLARLGAMERECGLATSAHEHLTLAQELCARYLPGDHVLSIQVAALARAPRSGTHACRQAGDDSGPPAVPGVVPVPRSRPAGVTAVAPRAEPADGWPPEGAYDAPYDAPPQGEQRWSGAGTPDSDRLLPVHLPRPERAASRRPVIVAGAITVGLVVAAALGAAALSRQDEPEDPPAPAAQSAPPGSTGPGSAPPGSTRPGSAPDSAGQGSAAPQTASLAGSASGPAAGVSPPAGATAAPGPATSAGPPTGLVLRDAAGGVTLQWRYPKGSEGPVVISGGRQGQAQQAFQQLPAGSSSYVVYGLNERANYCFTVSVVYSVDLVAESRPVCTARR